MHVKEKPTVSQSERVTSSHSIQVHAFALTYLFWKYLCYHMR